MFSPFSEWQQQDCQPITTTHGGASPNREELTDWPSYEVIIFLDEDLGDWPGWLPIGWLLVVVDGRLNQLARRLDRDHIPVTATEAVIIMVSENKNVSKSQMSTTITEIYQAIRSKNPQTIITWATRLPLTVPAVRINIKYNRNLNKIIKQINKICPAGQEVQIIQVHKWAVKQGYKWFDGFGIPSNEKTAILLYMVCQTARLVGLGGCGTEG